MTDTIPPICDRCLAPVARGRASCPACGKAYPTSLRIERERPPRRLFPGLVLLVLVWILVAIVRAYLRRVA